MGTLGLRSDSCYLALTRIAFAFAERKPMTSPCKRSVNKD